jgi:hypothetical protein
MDFHLEQVYVSPYQLVSRAYADPELYDALDSLPKLGRPEVLSHDLDGSIVKLEVRYRFTGHLSPAATAVIDPKRLTWVEHATHDLSTFSVTYRLVADHYADRFSSSGSYRFVPEGEGARRIVDGVVKVKALLVAGAVERAIISGLHEHADDEAALVDRFITEKTR